VYIYHSLHVSLAWFELDESAGNLKKTAPQETENLGPSCDLEKIDDPDVINNGLSNGFNGKTLSSSQERLSLLVSRVREVIGKFYHSVFKKGYGVSGHFLFFL